MSVSIEQWIKRRSTAAVAAGIGEWIEAPTSEFGRPIYRAVDGPVVLVLSELGFTYDGLPKSFKCRYDEVQKLSLAPLKEIMMREGDLLPRSELSRLLTLSVMRFGDQQPFEMQFSLRVYNQIATVLPRIVDELAQEERHSPRAG